MPSYCIKRLEYLPRNILLVRQNLEQIILIQKELNLSRWSFEDYIEEVKSPDSIFLVACFDEQIVGFMVIRLTYSGENSVRWYEEADLLNFGVAESFQRKGIGDSLFGVLLETLVEKTVSALWLEVRESNSEALKFYRKKGFQLIQTRKNFYSQPTENGLLMKLTLPAAKPNG